MFGSLFKKRISVDAVVDSILSALAKFDRMQVWGAELSRVSGLQIERAKEEMFYLDCFAVYIVLKFNDSPGWKQNGMKIFEKVFQGSAITVATTFAGKANATMEEVRKAGGTRSQGLNFCWRHSQFFAMVLLKRRCLGRVTISYTWAAYRFG